MGKRFYLGVGILLLFLVLGFGISWCMAAIHTPAERELRQAAQLALDDKMEQAVELAHSARARWEHYRKLTAGIADQSPMDETDQMFAEMEVYAQAQDKEHFAASCAQLSRLVSSMAEAHSPKWWNFL